MQPFKVRPAWAMPRYLLCVVTLLVAASTPANAAIYITGSWSTSTTNVPLESTKSQSASASLDVDLGRYIRIGVSYGLESSSSTGYQLPASTTNANAAATAGQKQTITCPTTTSCSTIRNSTYVVEKGAGLTIILWNGDVFMPYLTGGGVIKSYVFQTQIDNGPIDVRPGTYGPVPIVGAGIGMRLSRDFSLKFSYQVSPGLMMHPGETATHRVWDRKSTVGLSYQI